MPFRADLKLLKHKNACAPFALCYLSGANEDTVLRVCKLRGFQEQEGMLDDDIEVAAKDLGLILQRLSIKPIKVKSFLSRYKVGLWLVGTFDHVFVVDNGVMVDPRNKKPPGLHRTIKYLWRVI